MKLWSVFNWFETGSRGRIL